MTDKENRLVQAWSRTREWFKMPTAEATHPSAPLPPKLMIQATMLGSVGVGKTSLLAAIYDQFGNVIGPADLDIRPDGDTGRMLDRAVAKLQELPTRVRVQAALEGTAEVRHHRFDIGIPGRPSVFSLRVTDYPGQYMKPGIFPDRDVVEQTLVDSDVILLAIDTPALLELNGRFHNDINAPTAVLSELKRLLARRPDEPTLLILTLLKCETWVATPTDRAELIRKVKDKYQSLLDYIGSPSMRDRIGCVLTAVQTVGPIRLLETDTDTAADGTAAPIFRFRAVEVGATYKPVDTDQPLRWLLRFVINKYRADTRPTWRTVWERINGTDGRLAAAVDAFAAGCKTTDGCEILQPHPLLNPPRQAGPR